MPSSYANGTDSTPPFTSVLASAPEPGELVEQINSLVKKSARTGISADRVRPFARMLVAARNDDNWNTVGAEHSRKSAYEIVGELHGVDGYSNADQAEQAYRQGRKAKHNIHTSARAARASLTRLIEVVKNNHYALPLYVKENDFPQALNVALKSLNDLLVLAPMHHPKGVSQPNFKTVSRCFCCFVIPLPLPVATRPT